MVYLSACSNAREENNDRLLKGVNESLINACRNADDISGQIMKALQKKIDDPVTHDEYAKVWLPKAELIRKFSFEVYSYIETLKQEFAKQPVEVLINEKDKGIELYKMLIHYKKNLLGVDSSMNEEFKNNLFATTKIFDSLSEKDWAKTFFKDASLQQATVRLSKFQCDIKSIEFQILSFWFKKQASYDISNCEFWIPRIVAYHTTKYVKPNEMMEVHVGLEDDYSRMVKPIVSIDEKPVMLNNDFVAITTVKTSAKAGKHSLPINISYKDYKTGETRTMTKMFEYYVDSIPTKK